MTACGPGSSKPIRRQADEVSPSLTAPGVGRGLGRDGTLQDGRQAGDRASQLPGALPLAVDADGRTLGGVGAPFLRQGLQPHRAPRRRTSTTSHCQQ